MILSLLCGVGKCVLWISIVTELILQIYKYTKYICLYSACLDILIDTLTYVG